MGADHRTHAPLAGAEDLLTDGRRGPVHLSALLAGLSDRPQQIGQPLTVPAGGASHRSVRHRGIRDRHMGLDCLPV